MKFNLEFNSGEIRDAIMSGTLLSLVECISTSQAEVVSAAKILNGTDQGHSSPCPAQMPAQQTSIPMQSVPTQMLPVETTPVQTQVAQSTYIASQQQIPIAQQPQVQQVQMQQPVVTHGQPPMQQPQQQFVPQQGHAPAGVPTAAAAYSMEQLAVAATQICDAGRRTELVSLLNSFGVQALTALPKEQYGAFATQLRAMGAKI